MAITYSKQDWSIGSLVNVGFMKNLEVLKIEAIKDNGLYRI